MAAGQTFDADVDVVGPASPAPGRAGAAGGLRRKLLIAAVAALAVGGVGIAYASGLVDKLTPARSANAAGSGTPGSFDLPEIVSNLNAGGRRTAFVRIKARLELASKSDEPAVLAAQPRIQDLFQTYLRDMRPEELRGSAGTYRLREELIARANIAVAPARVTEILFIELLVQ
jgi:flagellar FliL protein